MQDSNSAHFDENSHEAERQNSTPQLVVEGADTFNSAAWQNAVKLTRRSVSSPYYLSSHEDDVCFNATLLQLLKREYKDSSERLVENLALLGLPLEQALELSGKG